MIEVFAYTYIISSLVIFIIIFLIVWLWFIEDKQDTLDINEFNNNVNKIKKEKLKIKRV